MGLLLKPDFNRGLGDPWKSCEIRHCSLAALEAGPTGKKGMCREGEPARLVKKAAPAEGEQVGRLGENTSWETWQVPIHFTIMKSIIKKKKVEMPSPFEGKRVLLLYKAVSLCFDSPLFELSSLAGRVSDIPDVWGIPSVVRGPKRLLCPAWRACSQCTGDCAKLSAGEHLLL